MLISKSEQNTKKPECIFPLYRNGELYRYMVRITNRKEKKYVGCFETREQATKARDEYLARLRKGPQA